MNFLLFYINLKKSINTGPCCICYFEHQLVKLLTYNLIILFSVIHELYLANFATNDTRRNIVRDWADNRCISATDNTLWDKTVPLTGAQFYINQLVNF